MDEKVIIQYKTSVKKLARIICIVCISIIVLILLYGKIISIQLDITKNTLKKMEAQESQLKEEASQISEDMTKISNQSKELCQKQLDNYYKEHTGTYVEINSKDKNLKRYYIDNNQVSEEEFEKLAQEIMDTLLDTQEGKELKEKYEDLEKTKEEIIKKKNEISKNVIETDKKSVALYDKHFDYMDNAQIFIGGFTGLFLLSIIFYFYISKMEIVVTNTRVYGKCAFGKRVDLPLDTISAVGTSFLKGIDIGTSAGRIHFKGIKNNKQIHEEISKLINNRQMNRKEPTTIINNSSNAEEIQKYKNLLDNGTITKEEFEAKKKQLLGL